MNQFVSSAPKKLIETLSEAEVLEIIKAAKKKHHKLAFILGFYQGLRVSEVVKLKLSDIDFGQKIIKIKEGKGSKDRNIPIIPQALKFLKHLPVGCGKRALEIAFKRYVGNAGISKDVHFHTLRHSCATWLLGVKKWDSRYVQRFLGHSSLQTTQIYTHVNPQDLVEKAWEGK